MSKITSYVAILLFSTGLYAGGSNLNFGVSGNQLDNETTHVSGDFGGDKNTLQLISSLAIMLQQSLF